MKDVVRDNTKQRFTMVLELPDGTSVGRANAEGDESDGVWWIKANQGHSISVRPIPFILIRLIECI